MKIQILGTGCPKCDTMMDRLEKIQKQGDFAFELEKVEDLVTIFQKGVMTTPGLIIDDELISQGRVYNEEALIDLLREKSK